MIEQKEYLKTVRTKDITVFSAEGDIKNISAPVVAKHLLAIVPVDDDKTLLTWYCRGLYDLINGESLLAINKGDVINFYLASICKDKESAEKIKSEWEDSFVVNPKQEEIIL